MCIRDRCFIDLVGADADADAVANKKKEMAEEDARMKQEIMEMGWPAWREKEKEKEEFKKWSKEMKDETDKEVKWEIEKKRRMMMARREADIEKSNREREMTLDMIAWRDEEIIVKKDRGSPSFIRCYVGT